MGAPLPDDDDFDDMTGLDAFLCGDNPIVEPGNGAPYDAPKGEASKVRANVDDSHSGKKDVESGGAVAASGKTTAEKTKGKPRGRPPLHLVDSKNPEQGDGRTVIHLDPDQLHTSVELVHIALGKTGKVFVRGHIPVEVRGFVSHSEKIEGPIAEGSPVVMQIESPTMAVIMAENCKFRHKKIIEDEPRECKTNPPDALATKVCKTASRRNHVPAILGVLECPSMRPDGTLITEPGFDEKTGYFLASNMVLPPIPDRPTIEDLERSIETLRLHFFWRA